MQHSDSLHWRGEHELRGADSLSKTTIPIHMKSALPVTSTIIIAVVLCLSYAVPRTTACSEGVEIGYTEKEFGLFTYGTPTSDNDAGEFPLTILDYPNSAVGQVTLPEAIDGEPVRAINRAFDNCRWVTSFSLPQSLESIAGPAFEGCHSLTQITIPRNVTEIGFRAFAKCSRLEAIDVDPENSAFLSIDGVLFSADFTRLIQFPGGKAGDYEIPEGVTTIERDAFRDALHVTGIVIPEGVTTIEANAFSGCHALKAIDFPDSLISIGTSAFAGCGIRQSYLVIPQNVEKVGPYAFKNWNALEEVTISKNVASMGMGTVGKGCDERYLYVASPFTGCRSLKSIAVEAGNEHFSCIDGVLFSSNARRMLQFPAGRTDTSYAIPESVTEVSASAFAECSNLTSITIARTVGSIAYSSFIGCDRLVSILVDEENELFTSIDGVLFSNQGEFELREYPAARPGNYAVPEKVTSLAPNAFENCSALTNVSISASVARISPNTFDNCAALTAISVDPANETFTSHEGVLINTERKLLVRYPAGKSGAYMIPEGIERIEADAFANSRELTGIGIPEGVESIGPRAFEGCTGLTQIDLPQSLDFIGERTFYGCSGIVGVRFKADNIENIISDAFGGCSNLESVYFGGNAPRHLEPNVFSGVAPDFSITYGRGTSGFTAPKWQGYPTSEEPTEPTAEKVQRTPDSMKIRWMVGGTENFNVYHSENLIDWTLITESPQPSVGALAIFEDTDPARTALASGYYRVRSQKSITQFHAAFR